MLVLVPCEAVFEPPPSIRRAKRGWEGASPRFGAETNVEYEYEYEYEHEHRCVEQDDESANSVEVRFLLLLLLFVLSEAVIELPPDIPRAKRGGR